MFLILSLMIFGQEINSAWFENIAKVLKLVT